MSYVRQAFGNAGEDRVSGLIAKKHITGAMSGAIGGLGLGMLVWGLSVTTAVLGLLGGVGGLIIMIDVGGLRLLDRLQLWAGYLLRRLAGATGVPPSSSIRALATTPTITYDGDIIARPYEAAAAPRRVAASQNGRAARRPVARARTARTARDRRRTARPRCFRPPKDSADACRACGLAADAVQSGVARRSRHAGTGAGCPWCAPGTTRCAFRPGRSPSRSTSRATASLERKQRLRHEQQALAPIAAAVAAWTDATPHAARAAHARAARGGGRGAGSGAATPRSARRATTGLLPCARLAIATGCCRGWTNICMILPTRTPS